VLLSLGGLFACVGEGMLAVLLHFGVMLVGESAPALTALTAAFSFAKLSMVLGGPMVDFVACARIPRVNSGDDGIERHDWLPVRTCLGWRCGQHDDECDCYFHFLFSFEKSGSGKSSSSLALKISVMMR
jgi:hypothetical protein